MPWATTAKIKVHAIFTQPGFENVEAVKKMLTVTNSAYKANNPTAMGVNFEFASSEKIFEQALIDEGPTREVEIQYHLARQARAVRYPGKLVVIFRSNGAGHQSSTWADYVVMFEPDGYAFAHEVGHYLHLGHTFNEGNISLLDKANQFFGFEGAKAAAIEAIRISGGLGAFDGDAGDPDAPEGGGFARVGDTPPDPGPPLFQPTYYAKDGTGHKSSTATANEECLVPGTLTLKVDGETYHLAPDRTNVMSYFFGCQNFVHTVSPHQRRVIKRVLAGGNRRHLVDGASPEGPASVVTPDGCIHVFARGDDRNIYRNVGKGTEWSGWQADMGAGTFVSSPAAVVTKDGAIHVFACGDDRNIWHNIWNGKVWSGWGGSDLAGGTLTSAPTAVVTPDGAIHVFARGDDRNIWHNFGWGKAWSGWKGGELGKGASLMSGPTAVVTKDGTIHVFACGNDRTVWHSFGKGQVWNGWKGGELGPGTLTSGPTAVVTKDGFIHILGRGDDRNIWHNFWNGKVWSGWKPHFSKDTFMSGVATVISGDNALHAFALSDARSIVHSSLSGQTWSGWDSKLAGGTFQP